MKNKNTIIFLGIGLILLIALSIFVRPKFKTKPKTISQKKAIPYNNYDFILPDNLKNKITSKEPLVLIDIRDSASYNKEHIEDSINITRKKLADDIKNLPKDKLTVIISYNFENKDIIGDVIKLLKNSGFNNIKVLSGGISNWKENNNPLIGDGDPESNVDLSKVEYLLPEQVKLAIDNHYPFLIIDARPKLLFLGGHIPGAINIPLNELEKQKNKISATDEIVVYARNELEDFKASVKLYDLGFLANYIIKGGFKEWKNKNFNIEK